MIRNDTNYLVDTKNWLKCLRWDILAPNNMVLFDPPTNYPIEMLPNDRNFATDEIIIQGSKRYS